MVCKKFELIPTKILFLRIFKVAKTVGQIPCTIVQGIFLNVINSLLDIWMKYHRDISLLLYFV